MTPSRYGATMDGRQRAPHQLPPGRHGLSHAYVAQNQREQIRLLGGSNAQRDLFAQMLVDAAVKGGRRGLVAEIIAHEATTRAVPPTERAGYAAAALWLA